MTGSGAAVASVASAGLPVALSSGNASGPVIQPEQATQVVQAFWPLRERALADDDTGMTDRLEDGVAREFDDAVSSFDHQIPPASRLRHVRDRGDITVVVPRQTGYPAEFLAAVPTTVYAADPSEGVAAGTPYVEMMVMTRRDARSRWMLSLDTGYQGDVQALFASSAGFAPDPPDLGWIDVGQLHPLLAQYWQHWKETGSAPPGTPFGPGYWTTQRGSGLVRQDAYSAHCGCFEHTEYHADPHDDGIFEFGLNTGTEPTLALVCSTIRYHDVFRPRPGDLLLQNSTRLNWGGGLAPGAYRSLTTDAVRQTCIIARTTRAAGLDVAGGNGDFVRVSGVPAVPVPLPHLPGGFPGSIPRWLAHHRPLGWIAIAVVIGLGTTGVLISAMYRRPVPPPPMPPLPPWWPPDPPPTT